LQRKKDFVAYARRCGKCGWVHWVDMKCDKENLAASDSFPRQEKLALQIL